MGNDYDSLLAKLGLGEEDFCRPTGRLSFDHYIAALRILNQEGSIPCLGYRLGNRKHFGSYGFLGIAMFTQDTFAEAANFGSQVFPLWLGNLLRMKIIPAGNQIILRYQASQSSISHDVTAIEETIMTGVRLISESLLGLDWSACHASFAFSPPKNAARYADYLPFSYSFDQPVNEFRVPSQWGNLPSALANKSVSDFCETQVQTILKTEFEFSYHQRQVRKILLNSDLENLPAAREVAARLEISERVLSEKLFKEGTSFRAILNDVVVDQAKLLLTDSRLPIKEIAARLGYSQTCSFHRAFCKTAGVTPLRFRINHFPHNF